jgi:hypothetical protein
MLLVLLLILLLLRLLVHFQLLVLLSCDADPDPVRSGLFWSDPVKDVWDRIRILALINDPILTFWVCVKSINTLGINVASLFGQ